MIIVDPYSTSYGALINKDKVSKELVKFSITADKNLNYEFRNGDNCEVVFILGKNEDERSLPIFNQPMLVKNMRNEQVVYCDLRKYVKQTREDDVLNAGSVFKDIAACKYLVNASLIMSDFASDTLGNYRNVFGHIAMGYSVLISNIVSMAIILNPLEKLDLEIALAYYASLLLIQDNDILDHKDSIVARLSNFRFSIPVNRKNINTVVDSINSIEINYDVDGLINVIKHILPDEKKELLNDKILITLLSNVWYGPGNNETLIMALECMPLFISLMYSCIQDPTYKRCKVATIFDKFSKNISNKEFVRLMELVLKEKRMGDVEY